MLIVNINTLCTICKLNFFNKVIINSFFTKDSKNIMRIYSTECKFCTFFNMCTLYDIFAKSCTVRNKIFLFFCCILIINNYMATLLDFFKSNITFDFRKNSKLLWLSCLKKFFYTRKTLCNICTAGNTTGMECSHCKLCTRFTD